MLSRTLRTARVARTARVTPLARFNSTAAFKEIKPESANTDKDPKVTSTNLYNESDPSRSHMFKYTWGTWLKNDEIEKAKRFTPFSLQGVNDLIKRSANIHKAGLNKKNPDEVRALDEKINIMSNNLGYFFEGEIGNIKQVISLHEGKHHRVYKIVLDGGKNLVLRLPYTLDSQLFTKRKIQSEVATMDFLSAALSLKIPRVLAYSGDIDNQLGHPFILMESIEAESSLMKKWNPLADSENDSLQDKKVKEELDQVIDPIADFQKIVNDFVFDNYGSIYFKNDCPNGITAYEGQDRWVIGPTVERAYYRNKQHVPEEVLNAHVGPWKASEPLKMIKDLVDLELHSLKIMLSMVDAQTIVESRDDLEAAIAVYTKFQLVANDIFNLNQDETIVPKIDELLKPRLNIADLDPMNVLAQKESFSFLDFENCSIKPFLITSYPKFIEYNGAKLFNPSEEIENYENLDELEKEQYKFMFKRTRNQFFWELALNARSKELLGVISPAVKLIKSSYLSALEVKSLKDYLYVQTGLIELRMMWENYQDNGLVPKLSQDELKQLSFSEDEIKTYQEKFNEYQVQMSSTPFAATGGWVPQDMFNNLVAQGMLIKDGTSWKVDAENVLK